MSNNGSRAGNKSSWCLHDWAWPQIAEHLKTDDTILIPFASTEQHGEHLPLGTDSFQGLEITRRAAERSQTLYTPMLWFGYSPHHMRSPGEGTGTITLRASTLLDVLYDISKSLVYHGFSRLIFVSGHASNTKVLDPLLRKLRYETGAFIALYKPWAERYLGIVEDLLTGPPEETPGWHAGELETAQVMAYDESLVLKDEMRVVTGHAPSWLPAGFEKNDAAPGVNFQGFEYFALPMEHSEISDTGLIGNPLRASKEQGNQTVDRFANYLVDALASFKRVPVEIKDRDWTARADW